MMTRVWAYTWAIAFVASLLPISGWSAPFSSLIVFGDSLSDTGNNAAVLDSAMPPPGTLRTPVPISSPTFIPDFPYASNRYSNGPVWVEGLAAGLGLSAQASLLGGTDFAFGGARSGPSGSSFPYSLLDQVDSFLTATHGIAPSNALYVVEGGGNDARDALDILGGGGDPSGVIGGFVNNIASIITELDLAGAQNILLADVPDIGMIPAVQAQGALAIGAASGIAKAMNDGLQTELGLLPASVRDGIRVLDLYGLLDDVVADPGAFGLTDATTPCALSQSCIDNPGGNFFWDGIHPTAAGHAILADAALRTVPEPGTVILIAIGVVSLWTFAFRAKTGTDPIFR